MALSAISMNSALADKEFVLSLHHKLHVSTCRGDRGWLMHFLVFLRYLVNGSTKYDHFVCAKCAIFPLFKKKNSLNFVIFSVHLNRLR